MTNIVIKNEETKEVLYIAEDVFYVKLKALKPDSANEVHVSNTKYNNIIDYLSLSKKEYIKDIERFINSIRLIIPYNIFNHIFSDELSEFNKELDSLLCKEHENIVDFTYKNEINDKLKDLIIDFEHKIFKCNSNIKFLQLIRKDIYDINTKSLDDDDIKYTKNLILNILDNLLSYLKDSISYLKDSIIIDKLKSL